MKKSLLMMRAQPFCVSIKVFRKILKPFPWGVRAKADAVVLPLPLFLGGCYLLRVC